jgi:hypothetical protein
VRSRRAGCACARPLKLIVMRHSAITLILALAGGVCHGQTTSAVITKEEATRIALTAAGCKKSDDCIAKGRLDRNQWVFVITFVEGRDAAGKPIVKPGGWMGITLDFQGHVMNRMPGE